MGIIQRTVTWLQAHRLVNCLLIAAYACIILFMHNTMVQTSVWVMNLLTLPVYNKAVMAISALGLLLYLVVLVQALYTSPGPRAMPVTCLVLTLGFMVLHFFTMFEMNIEIIHSMEYTVLCFLLYPLVGRYGAAVVGALPFMVVDEYYQYVWLYSQYTFYFEFNDIFMDIYGCALVVVALAITNVHTGVPLRPWWKRPELHGVLAGALIFFIALATCFISLYPQGACTHTLLVLNKLQHPEWFWRQYPGRDVVYHVARPIEGVTIIICLCLLYMNLDSPRQQKTAPVG